MTPVAASTVSKRFLRESFSHRLDTLYRLIHSVLGLTYDEIVNTCAGGCSSMNRSLLNIVAQANLTNRVSFVWYADAGRLSRVDVFDASGNMLRMLFTL